MTVARTSKAKSLRRDRVVSNELRKPHGVCTLGGLEEDRRVEALRTINALPWPGPSLLSNNPANVASPNAPLRNDMTVIPTVVVDRNCPGCFASASAARASARPSFAHC